MGASVCAGKMPFGLMTDFSREAFERLHELQYLLLPEHIEELKEMILAMQMWTMGGGFDVEALKLNEWTPAALWNRGLQEQKLNSTFRKLSSRDVVVYRGCLRQW